MQKIEASSNSYAGRGIVIVLRSDIFPATQGATVKIGRTAWGLSHIVDAAYLVMDDRTLYHVFKMGRHEVCAFPRFIRVLAPSGKKVRATLKARDVPDSDAFLYFPVVDRHYIVRTLWLGIRHRIMIYQAEFPAYAKACVWAKRLLSGKTLLVEHKVEYERLREQIPGLSSASYEYLCHLQLGLCCQVDAVIPVSEPDRIRLLADGVDPPRVHEADIAVLALLKGEVPA